MGKPLSIGSVPVIRPKIGVSTQVLHQSKWYKNVDHLGVDTLEINRRNSKLYFNQYFLEKVRRYLEGFHLGLDHGTLDWRRALDRLDLPRIRKVIIEVSAATYLEETRKVLEDYFRGRRVEADWPQPS